MQTELLRFIVNRDQAGYRSAFKGVLAIEDELTESQKAQLKLTEQLAGSIFDGSDLSTKDLLALSAQADQPFAVLAKLMIAAQTLKRLSEGNLYIDMDEFSRAAITAADTDWLVSNDLHEASFVAEKATKVIARKHAAEDDGGVFQTSGPTLF